MTKRIPVRVGVACGVGSLACLAASFPSPAAARKPITGKLSVRGYSVLALKANGKATSVRARWRSSVVKRSSPAPARAIA